MVVNEGGRFLRVACTRCGNRQIVFGKSSLRIKCVRCNKLLTEPKGGKIRIRTLVKEVFRHETQRR